MAKNMILEGDYKGKGIVVFKGQIGINVSPFKKPIILDKTNIHDYELLTEEHTKSAISGISRGLVGGALLGPVGLLAGVSAKNKGTYNVIFQLKDEKRFLAEIDDARYKILLRVMF